MDSTTTVYVTRPEPVTSSLTDGRPVLRVGNVGNGELCIALNRYHLTPVEQVDFLRALSEEAAELAVRVAALHAEPVVTACSCGAPDTTSLNAGEVVVHRTDGPCYIGDAKAAR